MLHARLFTATTSRLNAAGKPKKAESLHYYYEQQALRSPVLSRYTVRLGVYLLLLSGAQLRVGKKLKESLRFEPSGSVAFPDTGHEGSLMLIKYTL